jgi:hypothetical protein
LGFVSDSPRRRLRTTGDRLPGIARRTKTGIDKKSYLPQITSALTAITAIFAILISWLTFKMNRDGQISTRYTSATEQLGSASLLTRTGAVYSLGRIAGDSDFDRPVIVNMLADFIKQKTGIGVTGQDACHARDKPPPLDVIAALRVLFFEIEREPHDDRIDLRRVCLPQVEMPGADLTCVRLDSSIIEYAHFENATFVGTSLQHARLGGSHFDDADFTEASAYRAKFNTVDRYAPSDLTGARLIDTDLVRAELIGADLSGARLTRTRLEGADLSGADLSGAVLATYLGDVAKLPPDADRTRELAVPPSPPPAPDCS